MPMGFGRANARARGALRSRRTIVAVTAVAVAVALVAVVGVAGCSSASGRGFGSYGAGLSGEATPTMRAMGSAAGATASASALPPALAVAHPRKIDHSSDDNFDAARALADIRALTAFGVRGAGSAQEAEGAAWVARRVRELGYTPQTESFTLPNGKTSQNVFVVVPGTSNERLVLGAHIDSKPPSPGANDDASGVGILLEVARLLKEKPPTRTVEIVFFGSEEISDGNPDHHHAGSRYRASMMTPEERAATVGMLSVDMASFGTKAYIRTMGRGPMSFANRAVAEGKRLGLPIKYWRDPGKSGWSDHEPYENLGVPSAWLEWLEDPTYHTPRDTAERLSPTVVKQSGDLVMALIRR
jgi:Zn-dependent M28 family amino/carboxypeptidase